MGHYDLNTVIMRLCGVFSGTCLNVEQKTINERLKEQFGVDFIEIKDEDETTNLDLHWGTIQEIKAFLSGKYVGVGYKGDCFSYSKIDNYRELDSMIHDYVLITEKVKDVFPPIMISSQCQNKDIMSMAIIHNGQIIGRDESSLNLLKDGQPKKIKVTVEWD